jgi:hypothetical protein
MQNERDAFDPAARWHMCTYKGLGVSVASAMILKYRQIFWAFALNCIFYLPSIALTIAAITSSHRI